MAGPRGSARHAPRLQGLAAGPGWRGATPRILLLCLARRGVLALQAGQRRRLRLLVTRSSLSPCPTCFGPRRVRGRRSGFGHRLRHPLLHARCVGRALGGAGEMQPVLFWLAHGCTPRSCGFAGCSGGAQGFAPQTPQPRNVPCPDAAIADAYFCVKVRTPLDLPCPDARTPAHSTTVSCICSVRDLLKAP